MEKIIILGTCSLNRVEIIKELNKRVVSGESFLNRLGCVDETGYNGVIKKIFLDYFASKEKFVFQAVLNQKQLDELKAKQGKGEDLLMLFNESDAIDLNIFTTANAKKNISELGKDLSSKFGERFKFRGAFGGCRYGV